MWRLPAEIALEVQTLQQVWNAFATTLGHSTVLGPSKAAAVGQSLTSSL